MCRTVLEERADLGLALDGDGDRVVFCDEKGRVVDGDQALSMVALDLDGRGCLNQRTVVATIMSNMGMEVALRDRGIRMIRTPVGDRYVVEEMRRGGFNLGGEQSGHVIFLDHTTTGDGMITALQVLSLLRRSDRPLSELAETMAKFPQVLRNVRVAAKVPLEEIPGLGKEIREAEDRLGEKGRVLVRYSGTEPLLRVMVEGEDGGVIADIAGRLEEMVRERIGESP